MKQFDHNFFKLVEMCMFIYVYISLGMSINSYVILKTGDWEELSSVLGGFRIAGDSASYW